MNRTSIEWTHRPQTGGAAGGFTWNPIRARLKRRDTLAALTQAEMKRSGTFCTRVSPGCTHCYASVINKRFGNGLEYTVPNLEKVEFYIDEKILQEPLKRKKPATIFVGDMFDLFHEAIPNELIVQVLSVVALSDNHTFQILTKRAERMKDLFDFDYSFWGEVADAVESIGYTISPCIGHLVEELRDGNALPLRNLWLGVSVESQKYADERIPLLLQTPAAIRFLSVEPMLEAVSVSDSVCKLCRDSTERSGWHEKPTVNWVICGGESGPGARPFNLVWAESLLEQCMSTGTSFFFKQAGSFPVIAEDAWTKNYNPLDSPREHPLWLSARNDKRGDKPDGTVALGLKDRKGGDPSEWPEHLRVREFPA